jgi:hypothetical protein
MNFFSIYLIFPDALGPEVTQALTEMSTRSLKIIFLGSRRRPVRRTGNLTAICEPIVLTMCDPKHLTTLHACYGDKS